MVNMKVISESKNLILVVPPSGKIAWTKEQSFIQNALNKLRCLKW